MAEKIMIIGILNTQNMHHYHYFRGMALLAWKYEFGGGVAKVFKLVHFTNIGLFDLAQSVAILIIKSSRFPLCHCLFGFVDR